MNIYQAIMKAADHIERNPQDFNFFTTNFPDGCGTPGCALGWIGVFRGLRKSQYCDSFEGGGVTPVAINIGIDNPVIFYNRMHEVSDYSDWQYDASECAAALRLYAAKYHADEKPIERGIPAEVLAIFEPKVAA